MAKFIQVGLTAMRDPMTGQLLDSVPLYVEKTNDNDTALPTIDINAVVKDFMKKFSAEVEDKKEPPAGSSC